LQDALIAANFWALEPHGEAHGLDGAYWTIEGRRRDIFRAVHPLASAAVKLRLLCDEDIGLAASEPNPEELASLRQILEFVERDTAA
jgi:hypothetical protein